MAGLDSQQLNAIRHLLTDEVLRNTLLTGGIATEQSSKTPAPTESDSESDHTPQASRKRIPQKVSPRPNKQQRRNDAPSPRGSDKSVKNKHSNAGSGKGKAGRSRPKYTGHKTIAVPSKASVPLSAPKTDKHKQQKAPLYAEMHIDPVLIKSPLRLMFLTTNWIARRA
jgi:hypothetical protein